jgi:hypothetical protein
LRAFAPSLYDSIVSWNWVTSVAFPSDPADCLSNGAKVVKIRPQTTIPAHQTSGNRVCFLHKLTESLSVGLPIVILALFEPLPKPLTVSNPYFQSVFRSLVSEQIVTPELFTELDRRPFNDDVVNWIACDMGSGVNLDAHIALCLFERIRPLIVRLGVGNHVPTLFRCIVTELLKGEACLLAGDLDHGIAIFNVEIN